MMRDAVVVALLSQLSQQCGAALVRVRDELMPSTTFSRVVARRAVVPSCGTDGTHMRWGRHQAVCARRAGWKRRVVRAQTPGPAIEAPPLRRERNKYRS